MKDTQELHKFNRISTSWKSIRLTAGQLIRRQTIPVILSAVAMVTVQATAASAATPVVTAKGDGTDLSQFIGCLNVNAFKSMAPITNSITGKLITLVVIVAVILFIWNGAKLAFAGSRVDRTQDSLAGIKNIVIGILVISVGLGLLVAAVPLFFAGLCGN